MRYICSLLALRAQNKTMKTRSLILSLLLLSTHLSAFAGYFRHLGQEDGLSQSSVMAIYQDQLGRMWFGTREGLNVYDQEKITPYRGWVSGANSRCDSVLIGNEISFIKGDRKGDVFIVADGKLLKYSIRKESFQKVTSRIIYAMNTHDGNIWVASHDSIFMYNEQNGGLDFRHKVHLPMINYITVSELSILISTKKGLYEMNRKNGSVKCLIPEVDVYRTFYSSKKELWVGCRTEGLYRIDRAGKINKVPYMPFSPKGISSSQIREFVEDWHGNIWFGTFDGLQKYDPKKGTYTLINRTYDVGELAHKSIFSLYQDIQGTIWVGSYYGGVNYFNPDNHVFTYYSYDPDRRGDLDYPFAGEMVEDKRSNLWICTDGGGLTCLNRSTNEFSSYTAGGGNRLPHNNLKSICYDSKREVLYIGTHLGGLCRYDLKTKTFYNYLKMGYKGGKGPNDVVFKVCFHHDRLYVAARNGVFEMNPETNEFRVLVDDGRYYQTFDIDEKNQMWLATGSYITKLRLDNLQEVEHHSLKPFGCNFYIVKLLRSSDGKLYAATLGSGLFCYDEHKREFTRFTFEEGHLLSNYCYNLLETTDKSILITSNRGITLYKPHNGQFRSVELENGLLLSSIIDGCGTCVTNDNMIVVGGTNGLIAFKEKKLDAIYKTPKLYFSKLLVNNAEIRPDDDHGILSESLPFLKELDLKANQNSFTIEFATSNYIDILNSDSYEYRLEGFDRKWILTTHSRLNYTNLDPGTYILHVRKGTNALKNQYVQEISLKIVISPYWYHTWWAITLFILFILSLLYWIYRVVRLRRNLCLSLEIEKAEKKRIDELNQAKLHFFTNVSHEFRTPLTLIVTQVDMLLQKSKISPEVYNGISMINKHACQMKNLISELLDFRKFEQNHFVIHVSENNLGAFLKDIYATFYNYASGRHITFNLNIQEEDIVCWFDLKQMEKVMFNLLSNAFKYTADGGEVSIELEHKGHDLVLKVIDNGVGIAQNDLGQIFNAFYQSGNQQKVNSTFGTGIGLALTRTIIEKHGGVISVESQPGQGSTFQVILRTDRAHFEQRSDVALVTKEEQASYTPDSIINIIDDSRLSQTEIDDLVVDGVKKYKLLIVEDNEELLYTLEKIFQPFYQIVLAQDGEAGLRKVIEESPDIVISDVMMPVMSGTDLCVHIKNNIDLCHIPVILLTALDLVEQNIEGLGRGADDYITKPFNAQLLIARCNNLIRNRVLLKNQFVKKPIEDIDLVAINPLDKELLEKVVVIIEQNLDDEKFDVNVLCREIGLGRTSLYSKFKSLTGMTPNTFILNYKLKLAAAMLKNDDHLQIADIAFRLGFGSPVYFSRCFKTQYNMSPQDYRKSVRK